MCPGTGPAGRDESEPEPEPEPRPGPDRDRDGGCAQAAAAAGLGDAPSQFSLGQVGFDVMPVLRLCGASAAALARLALEPVPVLGLPAPVVLASLAPPLNSVLNIANRIGYGYPRPGQLVMRCRRRRRRREAIYLFPGDTKQNQQEGVKFDCVSCRRRETGGGGEGEGCGCLTQTSVCLRQRADGYRKQPARVDESTPTGRREA